MIWWLRARRAPAVAATAIVVGVVVWASSAGLAVSGSMASPIRAGAVVPLVLWVPLVVVVIVCWALAVDEDPGRRVGARQPRRLLTTYVVAIAAAQVAFLAPAFVAAPTATAAVARNVVGLLGLALVIRRHVGGPAAAGLTAGYLVVAALLGARPQGAAEWWAWPVADAPEPLGIVLAASCFVAGLASLHISSDASAVVRWVD